MPDGRLGQSAEDGRRDVRRSGTEEDAMGGAECVGKGAHPEMFTASPSGVKSGSQSQGREIPANPLATKKRAAW